MAKLVGIRLQESRAQLLDRRRCVNVYTKKKVVWVGALLWERGGLSLSQEESRRGMQ